jgi:putative ABC transport system permease protein
MPRGFSFPDPDDVFWIPLGLGPEPMANHGDRYLRVIARLKPNVSQEKAQAQMSEIAGRMAEEYPATNTDVGVNLVSLRHQMVGDYRPALMVLMGAVALVLLIACANIANLLLARSGARRGEFAIRAALGASRTRIVRQLLTESLVLSLMGATVGILLALEGARLLQLLRPPVLLGIAKIGLNGPVLIFSLGIAVGSGFVFGAAPAFQVARGELGGALKETSRSIQSRSQGITRGMLVIGETALGVVVLVGSVLLVRSYSRLQAVPLGFQPDGVLTMRVILPPAKYSEMAQRTAFYQEAIRRIEAVPGVQSAGAITFLPLTLFSNDYSLVIEGREPASYDQNPVADQRVVTPGYFRAIGMPLIDGRDFSWGDAPMSLPVAIVSQSLARTFWPGQDSTGKRLQVGPAGSPGPWLMVIGVVSDVSYFDLATPPQPTVYRPLSQNVDPRSGLRELAIRTAGNPLGLAPAVRDAIWSIDKDLPLDRVRTMDQVRSISVETRKFNLLLLALFACLALVLATVGLYGVTSYSAARRTHEMAIRVSLGALPRDIVLMVLRQGLWLAIAGVAAGSLLALGFSGLMARLVFGIKATDPPTFLIAAATLLTVDLVACYIPARRATMADPIEALRAQ